MFPIFGHESWDGQGPLWPAMSRSSGCAESLDAQLILVDALSFSRYNWTLKLVQQTGSMRWVYATFALLGGIFCVKVA